MLTPEVPTADPPLPPAEMCELVARLVFQGLPAPVSLLLRIGRPRVQVQAEHLDEWVAEFAVVGAWVPTGNNEHYYGRAVGFDLVAVREHVCEPAT